jgi:hypothetical protein
MKSRPFLGWMVTNRRTFDLEFSTGDNDGSDTERRQSWNENFLLEMNDLLKMT